MTSIPDFLTKKLFIEKEIVTYRSLSREFAIHVNVAKNELATYHANTPNPPAVTYLLTGEAPAVRARLDEDTGIETAIRLEDCIDEEGDEEEYVPQTKIVLVGEENLAGVISNFTRIFTRHVYSLSPSPIRDASLLCGPTDIVRQIDNSKNGAELGVVVGKVIGTHVQMDAAREMAPPAASLSKPKLSVIAKPPSKEKGHTKDQDKPKETETKIQEKDNAQPFVMEKIKPMGKLDFSRAKTKEVKKEVKIEMKAEQAKKVAETSASGAKSRQATEKKRPKEEPKRGTKRKSEGRVLFSDSDDVTSVAPSKPPSETEVRPRVRKGVVLSDEENVPRPSRRKALAVTSEAESDTEPSLRAMMDVDDDQVVRVSRSSAAQEEEEQEQEDQEETDQDMDIEPVPKAKNKPRKKKPVPVGRNGLKKKRLVKSRQTTDAKGYFVTEDYSSYESVDEEEPEPEKPAKSKRKKGLASVTVKEDIDATAAASTSKSKSGAKESSSLSSKPTLRRGKSTKNAKNDQRSLSNFFGPSKK